jgi:peptidoglycan/xylan/chitin deacetylase (PgdA/CDA1 family)
MMANDVPPQPDSPESALASRTPIIEYHDSEYKGGATVQMKTEWFLEKMQWLSDNGFKSLTGEEIINFIYGAARPTQKFFALRFDLGLPVLANFRDVIVPTLKKYSFHATFFVLTKMVKDASQKNYIIWDQLKEWKQTGLIEIGSHGVNHPDYR